MSDKLNNWRLDEKQEESVRFVATHYRKDAFAVKTPLWRKLSEGHNKWRRWSVAAAVAGGIFVASAIGLYFGLGYNSHSDLQQPLDTAAPAPVLTQPSRQADIPRVISFSNAPISRVCKEIETVYGVTLVNVPDTDDTLTLEYEGTATEIVDVINELMGTQIRIAE